MVFDKYTISPPCDVRDMRHLRREQFRCIRDVCLVRLPQRVSDIGRALAPLKKYLLKLPNLSTVRTLREMLPYLLPADERSSVELGWPIDTRVTCLNPALVSTHSDLPSALFPILAPESLTHVRLQLTYDNFSYQAVLKAVLPVEQPGFGGFSQIGHILHLNLREHLMPYRFLIGSVLLDKVPHINIVVNKSDPIDTTYRNFTMERLASVRLNGAVKEKSSVCADGSDGISDRNVVKLDGDGGEEVDSQLIVCVRENGCQFRLDFGRVYWNPRLSTEHERLVAMLRPGEAVYDACAGVGPFAVPAARKGCRPVLANDLNPESFCWLRRNLDANCKALGRDQPRCYNMCARRFIESIVRQDILERLQPLGLKNSVAPVETKDHNGGKPINTDKRCIREGHDDPLHCHVIMNLPASAVFFCDAMVGLLSDPPYALASMPHVLVHVYMFTRDVSDADADVRKQLTHVLRDAGVSSTDVTHCVRQVVFVRSVAPNKHMYRLTWHASTKILCFDCKPASKIAKSDV